MGKTRKSKATAESDTSKYVTPTGERIDLENHTDEFFKHLENNIVGWIKYGGASPDFFLTGEEREYILGHMTDSDNDGSVPSGHLTRVEKARHFQKHNYRVGDYIEDSATLRSYSRNQEGTLEYIQRNGNEDRAIIIYRTNGNIKHFNATKFDNTYDWEAESFVQQSKMKITAINELKGETLQTLPKELGLNINVNSLEKPLPYSITIVDIEQV